MHSSSFQFIYRSNLLFQSTGKGAPLQLITKFESFRSMVEATIERILRELGLNWDLLHESMRVLLERGDCSAQSLRRTLDEFCTFLPFCRLMEQKCMEFNPSFSRHVRVLWDIENISIPKGMGPADAVDQLVQFLDTNGLSGVGIDTRISAFCRPTGSKFSQKISGELGKTRVEVIVCNSKKEDADRKIVDRIDNERAILVPSKTSFILISSDRDFCRVMSSLKNAGFYCAVIHHIPASPANESWLQAIKLCCNKVLFWEDIVKPALRGLEGSSDTDMADK